MLIKSVIICVALFSLSIANGRSRASLDNVSNQRPNIWAVHAVEYLRNLTCDHIFYTVLHQCQQMKRTATNRFQVYAAEGSKQTKLLTVLADGPLSRSNDHDGVLVLDPFPEASFGHLIFVFFIEHIKPTMISLQDRAKCENTGGIFIGKINFFELLLNCDELIFNEFTENHNDCLRLALRDGCQKSFRRGSYHKRRRTNQRCEIDLLPSVYETSNSLESDVEVSSGQILRCRNVAGFAHCPDLYRNSLYGSVCDEDETNDECAKKLSEKMPVRCRMFETCDHAVILHGAWNRITSKASDMQMLQETRTMLSFNGFPEENVKTFYADGEIYLPGANFLKLETYSIIVRRSTYVRNMLQN